jgi:hypothetical protein
MSSSTERQTAIILTPPPEPRLRLQPDRSARPGTSEQDAQAGMEQAAQAGNRSHTHALLAAVTPLASPAPMTAPQSIQLSTWEWEGGQLRDRTLPAASADPHATLLSAAGPRRS